MASSALYRVAGALKTVEEKCSALLENDEGNVLLLSARAVCTKLTHQINVGGRVTLSEALQGYGQAILDFTYVGEKQLVKEEFSKSSTDEKIRIVFKLLDKVTQLTAELLPNQNFVDVLTADLYECFLWRKGALLYMYCACLERDQARNPSAIFLQSLQQGVYYLQDLLKVRIPVSENTEGIEFTDLETLQLLQSGLFSDVHVLAMMYCGEMCFWLEKYSKNSNSNDFDSKSAGLKFLGEYIKAVKGPLKGKGWNCDRAELLLKVLQGR